MRLRTILLLLAGGLLTSCATTTSSKYDGPKGASYTDFAKARTICYTQLKSQGSSGSSNEYGAYYSSGPTVSCGAFTGCLASKGYTSNDETGKFDSKGITFNCN